MKNRIVISILIAVILMLSLITPTLAMPSHNIEISNFNVELVSGGQVGVETTIRISVTVNAEAITDATRYKDMAVCQGLLKYYIIDSSWYLIDRDKVEEVAKNYEYPTYGTGASATLNWQPSVEYTWTPYISGTHYVSAEIYGYTSVTDGSWPPRWIHDYVKEYHFAAIDIAEAPLSSWMNSENFEVLVGSCYESYSFDELTIGEEVNQECLIDGHVVALQIASGTMILGAGKLSIDYDGNNVIVSVPVDAVFSNPVTVTVDGSPSLIFTSISGGIPL